MLCLFLALFIVQGVFVFVVFESSLVGKRSVDQFARTIPP